MKINIPDKLYKLLVLVGIISFGYGLYGIDKSERFYFTKIDENRELFDSVLISKMKHENLKGKLENTSRQLSVKYDIKDPVKSTDSIISFVRVLTGDKNEVLVSDSIQKLWESYNESRFKLDMLIEKQERANNYLDEEKDLKSTYIASYLEFRNIGIGLFIIGLFMWGVDASSNTNQKSIVRQHDKLYPYCQSCGVNFNSMRSYGTNKDKSLNYAFCSVCYKKGKFREPDLTKDELIERNMDKYKKKSKAFYWIVKRLIKYRINGLERWY